MNENIVVRSWIRTAQKLADKVEELKKEALEREILLAEQEVQIEALQAMIEEITGYAYDDFSFEAMASRHEWDLLKEVLKD